MSKTILELAQQADEAHKYVNTLAMVNTSGRTPQEDIIARAIYRLAMDASLKADAEYRAAIANLSTDELFAIVKAAKP